MKGIYKEKSDAKNHFLENVSIRCNYCNCYLDQHTIVVRENNKGKKFPSCFNCNRHINKFGIPPNNKKELPDFTNKGKKLTWDNSQRKSTKR